MEEYTQFFNMVPEKEEWHKKLELKLGPPGEEIFLCQKTNNPTTHGAKRSLQDTNKAKKEEGNWQCKKLSCYGEEEEEAAEKVFTSPWLSESLHSPTFHREAAQKELLCHHKVASSIPASASFPGTSTAGTNSFDKRVAVAPVVGWPPIRSFRKNLACANTTSKLMVSELSDKTPEEGTSLKPAECFRNEYLFVKINMEGIPIGRKINLKAYDSYEKLSVAIDELFRGLLAAQMESTDPGDENQMDVAKANSGSVAASGEYTLVYEDNEGDRILVGDVPWHMFVSTAKRLHVLKSSEISTPNLVSATKEKTPLN